MANAAKYLELADRLAERIREEYEPGDRFPTVTELAQLYGVAPNTASRAVQTLKEQGLLAGKAGGTTWVRVPPVSSVRRNTRYQAEKDLVLRPEEERRATGVAELDSRVSLSSVHEDHVQIDVVPAPSDVADALGIPTGALVMRRIGTRRFKRGAGVGKSVSYMPHDLATRNPALFDPDNEPWPGGAQHQLHTVGIEVGRIEDWVTASMPNESEMQEQDIPPGVPVIRIRKVTYSTSGQPVEVADIPLPADRAQLVYVTPLKPWS
ncbi:GntR family transcriptional regulator [Streptomyces sp. B3I7]|uniref:GntR family transcriptional regulator n=1 Tax=Streptomyces sp. B3I7 TaxID=3042269 RepID=UPI00278432A3|nr:GntR family transcriptional regulator [Streptomyces sp. B3I7]MDQ0808760.1 GntR family transcriptional regulator [Streptomyces sp. B3I7]